MKKQIERLETLEIKAAKTEAPKILVATLRGGAYFLKDDATPYNKEELLIKTNNEVLILSDNSSDDLDMVKIQIVPEVKEIIEEFIREL
ncbi:hypothetical protein YH65_10795 [Sulfurovum lithotrophicum]|uniref:Uncharacterized protein n=1 Tax=Sulfurovum lithotrophicum TaxID=206403 RepID=A0A7U4M2S8_9BACT|nr:hypothetical protein [Sulfurovum lithotrophicum]AKF25817.1 hypothetical protein YH65_10795 [Sulfurovum lithotrophicum]